MWIRAIKTCDPGVFQEEFHTKQNRVLKILAKANVQDPATLFRGTNKAEEEKVALSDLIFPTCFEFNTMIIPPDEPDNPMPKIPPKVEECLRRSGVLSEHELFEKIVQYAPRDWAAKLRAFRANRS